MAAARSGTPEVRRSGRYGVVGCRSPSRAQPEAAPTDLRRTAVYPISPAGSVVPFHPSSPLSTRSSPGTSGCGCTSPAGSDRGFTVPVRSCCTRCLRPWYVRPPSRGRDIRPSRRSRSRSQERRRGKGRSGVSPGGRSGQMPSRGGGGARQWCLPLSLRWVSECPGNGRSRPPSRSLLFPRRRVWGQLPPHER